jgi:hypothetical protein
MEKPETLLKCVFQKESILLILLKFMGMVKGEQKQIKGLKIK